MSGIGPQDGKKYSEQEVEDFKTLVSDPSYPMMAEFVGQLKGGRWLVRFQGKEDKADLAELMVEVGICQVKEDPPSTLPSEKASTAQEVQPPVSEEIKKVETPAPVKLVRGPVVASREMPEDCEGTVRCLESPDTFYILPTTSQDLSTAMRDMIQTSSVQGGVELVTGTCCLARDKEDGLYYRAEIREVSQGGAVKLFLIDHGKVVEEDGTMLRLLPEKLVSCFWWPAASTPSAGLSTPLRCSSLM